MRILPLLLLSATLLSQVAFAQNTKNFPSIGRIHREDPRLDQLIAPDAKIEVLAGGFEWAEGPVWYPPAGGLLFSDIPNNAVILWKEGVGTSVYMKPSGYTGVDKYSAEPGSNGITVDLEGRLVFAEHGDRRISVLTKDGGKRTLVDNYMGKRLNSPNDVVFDSQGNMYFTDPPYGLPKQANDPSREMDYCGVFRLGKDGKLTLLTKDLARPNGVALSPDEKTLYVAQSDRAKAIWMAYPLNADGTIGTGRVFADVTPMMGKLRGSPDGMKVDAQGNLFASGPGGIHIYAPDGKLLGRIETGEASANVAWGDDGSTLYITADMWLCRVKTKTKGAGLRWMSAGVK
jgi:gluconolactonase